MTELDLSTGHDAEIDFKAVKHRFLSLNQARLQQIRATLRERQRRILDLLPLLFHVNHPLLPGYVSRFTPCGVWGYEPDRKTLNQARALARSFSYQKPTRKQTPVHALYCMGSSGTIAHSEQSDFDIWLCHDPQLNREQCSALLHKASSIEQWADELGLEIHFFLINPETFRHGDHSTALSADSSGTAQHSLLLDEFYRTSVLLQGKPPLWWLVPPGYEAAYELYVEELQRKRFIYARDTIDFGGLAHIPAEEFFGAALWQLSKGIDAPYKSLLKLLLLEIYADEYPALELLSKQFKQAVYAGENNPQQLDPYLLMLHKVSHYLQAQQQQQRLELARRCFYFKAGLRLSTPPADSRGQWRHELLLALAADWGWSHADLLVMDMHRQWNVHRVLQERQILFQALMQSYRRLSEFARHYSGLSLISQQDLTTLGRKLFAAYERKAGKIELLTRGIDAELLEPQLTLSEVRHSSGEISWQLYSGAISQEQLAQATPIKRARSLTELLAWSHLNGVSGATTHHLLYSSHSKYSTREVENLVTRIAHSFPCDMLQGARTLDYAAPSQLLHSEFYINTGVNLPDNMLVTRNLAAAGQTDPFRFGHQGENLIMAIDMLALNSWREAFSYRFHDEHALADALCHYLKWFPPSQQLKPPVPIFYSGNSAQGTAVAKRVAELFHAVIEHLYVAQQHGHPHYLVTIGNYHYIFFFDGDTPRYELAQGDGKLTAALGKSRHESLSLQFDQRSLQEGFLPLIYAHNQPSVIQMFFLPQGTEADIYVLDEKGALFQHRVAYSDEQTLCNHFTRFFEAISNRINLLLQGGSPDTAIKGIEFYRLSCDNTRQRQAQRLNTTPGSQQGGYISLQVIVEQNERQESLFTLYCDGREFSTLEHGDRLFDAVVQYIMQLRNSGMRYPIYITDISLDRPVIGDENVDKVQTSLFLNYKRRIEEELNRSL